MKDIDYIITQKETEQLCRLYMDCALTVQEETELQFVLCHLPYSSPLIDDVRLLMGIQTSVEKNRRDFRVYKKIWRHPSFLKIVASIAIIVGIALSIYKAQPTEQISSGPIYIVYKDGIKLNEAETMIQIEADKKKMEAFKKKIAEIEMREKQEQELFNNLINNKFNQK